MGLAGYGYISQGTYSAGLQCLDCKSRFRLTGKSGESRSLISDEGMQDCTQPRPMENPARSAAESVAAH